MDLRDIKVGIIIPDRNDRPKFLENCKRLLKSQTLQPHTINIVNYSPLSEECDITQRYRIGYEELRNKGLDVIAFIENDDWYSADYLEYMVTEWLKNGKPDIIGTEFTVYYNVKLLSHLTMFHANRSSAMSTLIKPDLNFTWCQDSDPYTDMHLWNVVRGVIIHPTKKYVCLGIKHGEGKCGGVGHTTKLNAFINKDYEKIFLKEVMDEESFKFYTNYFN